MLISTFPDDSRWFFSAGVSLSGCIPDKLNWLVSLMGVHIVLTFWACSGELHWGLTLPCFSPQQILGWGVPCFVGHLRGLLKLFSQRTVPSDDTELLVLVLVPDTAVKDDGIRSGVVELLFAWTTDTSPFADTMFCPLAGRDDFAGEDIASNSFVREIRVLAKSESSVANLRLRIFDVADSVNVFVGSWSKGILLWGVLLSVFAMGVLNWRFLMGVHIWDVPLRRKNKSDQLFKQKKNMEKYKDNDRIKDATCAVAKGISLKKIYPCWDLNPGCCDTSGALLPMN